MVAKSDPVLVGIPAPQRWPAILASHATSVANMRAEGGHCERKRWRLVYNFAFGGSNDGSIMSRMSLAASFR